MLLRHRNAWDDANHDFALVDFAILRQCLSRLDLCLVLDVHPIAAVLIGDMLQNDAILSKLLQILRELDI